MGVAGGFWELVKPVARYEDVEYLKGKKVSVDLSYWIVQQETALKGNARKPHLRVTFFRTVNLFAKVFLSGPHLLQQKLNSVMVFDYVSIWVTMFQTNM